MTIYSTDIEASSLYLYSLSEQKEAPFVYALISQSEQGRSPSSEVSVLIIDLNRHRIKAWSQNSFMAVSFAEKYGFVFIGGTNTDTNEGMLLKTIPTDLDLLGESLKFTFNKYTMQAIEDTSYSLSTITSTVTTSVRSLITLITSLLDILIFSGGSVSNVESLSSSPFYLNSSLYHSSSVIAGTNATVNIGLPCTTSGILNLSFEADVTLSKNKYRGNLKIELNSILHKITVINH